MFTASDIRLSYSGSLSALSLLLGLTGCGSQGTEDYLGESMLHLEGQVLLEDEDAPAGLQPALAFLQQNSSEDESEGLVEYRMVDAEVSGDFPAKFSLDLFEPPPADVQLFELESENGDQVGLAVAVLAAVTPDRPDVIAPSVKNSQALCFEFGNQCLVSEQWCNAEENCYEQSLLCEAESDAREELEQCITTVTGDPGLWNLEDGFALETSAECNEDECRIIEELCDGFSEDSQCYRYEHHCPASVATWLSAGADRDSSDSAWDSADGSDFEDHGSSSGFAEGSGDSSGIGDVEGGFGSGDDAEGGDIPSDDEEPSGATDDSEEWLESEWQSVDIDYSIYGNVEPDRARCQVLAETGDKEEHVAFNEYFAGVAPGLLIYYATEDFIPKDIPPGTPDVFPLQRGYNAFHIEAPTEEAQTEYFECYSAAYESVFIDYESAGTEYTLEELDAAADEAAEAAGCVIPSFKMERVEGKDKLTLPVSRDATDLSVLSL